MYVWVCIVCAFVFGVCVCVCVCACVCVCVCVCACVCLCVCVHVYARVRVLIPYNYLTAVIAHAYTHNTHLLHHFHGNGSLASHDVRVIGGGYKC